MEILFWFVSWLLHISKCTFCLHRKLKGVKEENQNILNGETMMTWMSTSGIVHFLVYSAFSCDKIRPIKYFVGVKCRSVDCFRLGWPMRADADFFCQPIEKVPADKNEVLYNLDIHAIFYLFFSVYINLLCLSTSLSFKIMEYCPIFVTSYVTSELACSRLIYALIYL